jgi:hypothetical protein
MMRNYSKFQFAKSFDFTCSRGVPHVDDIKFFAQFLHRVLAVEQRRRRRAVLITIVNGRVCLENVNLKLEDRIPQIRLTKQAKLN